MELGPAQHVLQRLAGHPALDQRGQLGGSAVAAVSSRASSSANTQPAARSRSRRSTSRSWTQARAYRRGRRSATRRYSRGCTEPLRPAAESWSVGAVIGRARRTRRSSAAAPAVSTARAAVVPPGPADRVGRPGARPARPGRRSRCRSGRCRRRRRPPPARRPGPAGRSARSARRPAVVARGAEVRPVDPLGRPVRPPRRAAAASPSGARAGPAGGPGTARTAGSGPAGSGSRRPRPRTGGPVRQRDRPDQLLAHRPIMPSGRGTGQPDERARWWSRPARHHRGALVGAGPAERWPVARGGSRLQDRRMIVVDRLAEAGDTPFLVVDRRDPGAQPGRDGRAGAHGRVRAAPARQDAQVPADRRAGSSSSARSD